MLRSNISTFREDLFLFIFPRDVSTSYMQEFSKRSYVNIHRIFCFL